MSFRFFKDREGSRHCDLGGFSDCLSTKVFFVAFRQDRIIELSQLRQGIMSLDEYQQKFYSLMSHSPHIDASEEGKYYQFL